ncbi:MAG: hypothetical protein RL220_1170 [Bacteroidota bacterium]|jgi:hypothetical protein
MKKILMLALFCLPIVAFSQDKSKDTKTKPETTAPAVDPSGRPAGKGTVPAKQYTLETLYGELISTTIQGRTSIRLDFGRESLVNIKDKTVQGEIEELRNTAYGSVADALNYLGAQGFKVISTYNSSSDDNIEIRFVLEKRLTKGNAPDSAGGVQKAPGAPREPGAPAPAPVRPDPKAPSKDAKEKEKK